jgi:hypothetical protein
VASKPVKCRSGRQKGFFLFFFFSLFFGGGGLSQKFALQSFHLHKEGLFILFKFIFETEGRQASAKAQKVVDHLASFPSG